MSHFQHGSREQRYVRRGEMLRNSSGSSKTVQSIDSKPPLTVQDPEAHVTADTQMKSRDPSKHSHQSPTSRRTLQSQLQSQPQTTKQIVPPIQSFEYAAHKRELQQLILAITDMEEDLVSICHKTIFLSLWHIRAMSSTGMMINPIAVEIHNFAMQTTQGIGEPDNRHLLDILVHMSETLESVEALANILFQRQKTLEVASVRLQWAEPYLHGFWVHLHQIQPNTPHDEQN